MLELVVLAVTLLLGAYIVKKTMIALAFAFLLFVSVPGTVSVWADASTNGCLHSGNQAAGCTATSTPEPSSLAMLATGLIAVGALCFFGRKKLANLAR
jgi:hypothetical protein